MGESINEKLALEQLENSSKLYLVVLRGFLRKYTKVDQDIQTLHDENDFFDAKRLAHSIKGLSGNVGAMDLREYANNLEKKLEMKETDVAVDVSQEMMGFSEELEKVVRDIELLIIKHEK